MTRNLPILFVLLVLAGLLVFGFHTLFSLRFESGDVYPKGSTLRADPLGCKIFYDSLAELDGVKVERNLKSRVPATAEGGVLIYLHSTLLPLRLLELEKDCADHLAAGGRVVLASRSLDARWRKQKKTDGIEGEKEDEPVEEEKGCDAEGHDSESCFKCKRKKFTKLWGAYFARFSQKELGESEEDIPRYAVPEPRVAGWGRVPWNSALYFDGLDENWRVLYRYNGQPVIAERALGGGSVVMMADSYLFSNEAMVKDRHSEFLTGLLGASRYLIFDEFHLGIRSQEGVMMLLNRYRLQGVLLALLVVGVLFFWKNSCSFIPSYQATAEAGEGLSNGVTSHEGFTNLLMRHIPRNQLLAAMAEEWRATFARQPNMRDKLKRLEAEMEPIDFKQKGAPHPVEFYNRLSRILNERK